MPDLLLELRSEEIPARMQPRGAELLRGAVESRLKDRGLDWKTAEAFATPRRLALIIRGLPDEIPESREERRGPRVSAPEKALAGFLRSTGLTHEKIEVRGEGADAVYFVVWDNPAQSLHEILAMELPQALRSITWPKSMRWGRGNFRWIRPLRSILCIVDDDAGSRVVELDVEGIPCGRVTCGHPYMAPDEFVVESVDSYESRLHQARVILRAEDRHDRITKGLRKASESGRLGLEEPSGQPSNSDLVNEIVGLVEWPVVLVGRVDDKFSDLPSQILQTSMRKNQKFFSLSDIIKNHITHFVAVADIQAADGGAHIIKGYERVLRARLTDAQFFWKNDLRTGLEAMGGGLSEMVFHSALGGIGNMKARTERISKLAEEIAVHIGELPADMARAGEISKIDLCSETVREFPELQGVAGARLAQAARENANVVYAVMKQYRTLSSGYTKFENDKDTAALILADRADMLWGLFAVGERPTGSRDPYALRRAALDISWTLIKKEINLSLHNLMAMAEKTYGETPLPEREDASDAAVELILGRLRGYLRDFESRRKISELIAAASRRGAEDNPYRFHCQFRALDRFFSLERNSSADDLLATHRRVTSILDANEIPVPEPDLYIKQEECSLAEALDHAEEEIERLRLSEREAERVRKKKRGEGENTWNIKPLQRGLLEAIEHCYKNSNDAHANHSRLNRPWIAQGAWLTPHWAVRRVLEDIHNHHPNPKLSQVALEALARLHEAFDCLSKDAGGSNVNDHNLRSYHDSLKILGNLLELMTPFLEDTVDVPIDDPTPELRQTVLVTLAKLRGPVDSFFEGVHVNDPDPDLRRNRHRLLARVRDVMEQVADFRAIES